MPFEFSHLDLPSGPCLRIHASGWVELADGKALELLLKPAQGTLPKILGVIVDGTRYSPEVRRLFSAMDMDLSAMALVVWSPVVRAAVNMIIRIGSTDLSGPVRLFTDEAEASAWIDEQPPVEA